MAAGGGSSTWFGAVDLFHRPVGRDWSGDAWIANRGEAVAYPPRGPARLFAAELKTPRADSVPGLSTGKVLLGALATSIPANAGAYALLLKGGYSPRGSAAAPLLILGGAIAGVAGPAIGARLAGGGFMPGVLGSVVGIGLGGLTAGVAIGDDRGVHEAVLFSVFSLVHAGITTLFVVKAEQYAAAGR